jgi:hypothetical protein
MCPHLPKYPFTLSDQILHAFVISSVPITLRVHLIPTAINILIEMQILTAYYNLHTTVLTFMQNLHSLKRCRYYRKYGIKRYNISITE